MLLLALIGAAAMAQPGWQRPNSTVGVGVAPWGLTVRGEAWMSGELSAELGVGLRGFDPEQPVGDWAVRWRPRFACFGCGERALVTIGAGVGGTVIPDFGGGPWGLGLGPDLAVTGIYWTSHAVGLQATGRVGLGPTVSTDGFEVGVVEPWFMLSGGLAF